MANKVQIGRNFPTPGSVKELSVDRIHHGESTNARLQQAFRFASLESYSIGERLRIRTVDLFLFLAIKLIGRTVKLETEGWENWEAASRDEKIPIYTFWHNQIFLATYFWQRRGIVVMTSRSFDGEYIARFIQRFGYGAARGSSTRNATGAIVEMIRLMRNGCPTAFTIDGPKGPRYVAKMGAVLLAKKTGNPILPFTITANRFWEAKKSWDRSQVPKPFARGHLLIGSPIYVPADADEPLLNSKRAELQSALGELNRRGDVNYSHV